MAVDQKLFERMVVAFERIATSLEKAPAAAKGSRGAAKAEGATKEREKIKRASDDQPRLAIEGYVIKAKEREGKKNTWLNVCVEDVDDQSREVWISTNETDHWNALVRAYNAQEQGLNYIVRVEYHEKQSGDWTNRYVASVAVLEDGSSDGTSSDAKAAQDDDEEVPF